VKKNVVPMIHVPDVAATVAWYRDIGFKVVETYGHEGEGLSFAILAFGESQVMFSEGGRSSAQHRREVDLYVYTDNVDDKYQTLRARVDVVEGPHNTFYGMRELIIRDLNRFWITFGQPSTYGMLLDAIRNDNVASMRGILERGDLKSEELTNALVTASDDQKSEEIISVLKQAGAQPPPEVAADVLQAHVGRYKSEGGMEANLRLSDGKLIAEPGGEGCLRLVPIDEVTFRPLLFSGVTVKFKVEGGQTTGFELKDGARSTEFQRVGEST